MTDTGDQNPLDVAALLTKLLRKQERKMKRMEAALKQLEGELWSEGREMMGIGYKEDDSELVRLTAFYQIVKRGLK